ncbi:MAG: hypothetical protein R3F59_29235 [Myxococcota bacterium]
MADPAVGDGVRALLRAAAVAEGRWRDAQEELPDAGRWLPPEDARAIALMRLFADAVLTCNRYGLRANLLLPATFRFEVADRTLRVALPGSLRQGLVGELREASPDGGPVRAVMVPLGPVAWDAALGWVDAASGGSALDLVLRQILDRLLPR